MHAQACKQARQAGQVNPTGKGAPAVSVVEELQIQNSDDGKRNTDGCGASWSRQSPAASTSKGNGAGFCHADQWRVAGQPSKSPVNRDQYCSVRQTPRARKGGGCRDAQVGDIWREVGRGRVNGGRYKVHAYFAPSLHQTK